MAATPTLSYASSFSSKTLQIALGVSLVLHGGLLAVRFAVPEALSLKAEDPKLEVILVNAKSGTEPVKAEALAQVALEGGGDKDAGRARSPLPNSVRVEDGDALRDAKQRLELLEEEQKKLLAQLRKTPLLTPEFNNKPTNNEPREQNTTGDLLEQAKAIARMEAQIDKRIEDYNKRPKKHFYSPSTSEYRFARYVEDWRAKIERLGNQNYPEEAKGKLYGQLRLTVYIRSDGTIDSIEFDERSKHEVLNQAAVNIVKMAAPYASFPSNIAQDTDILAITRTWVFTNDALETQQR